MARISFFLQDPKTIMADNVAGEATGSATDTTTAIPVSGPRVACNGGGGPLGHPQVWLTLGTDGEITCPYCSRHYVKSSGADDE